jgi:hypothetical protein
MNNSFTTDELKALAKFPFEDPQWKTKFLIGCLIIFAGYIIPWLPMIFVYGYCAQIMYRIIVEKGTPYLPNWDNWGKLFIDGLKIFGASIIYSLPFLLIFFAGMGLFFASIISLEAAPREPEAVSSIMALFPVIGIMAWFGSFSLGMILALAVGVILPVAIAHMIATNEFAAAFRVREWWAIFRANWTGYLIAYVLILGFWMVLSFAMQILYFTIIFCCLVPFVMIFVVMYVMVIGSVLFAKTYRTGSEKLATQTIVP